MGKPNQEMVHTSVNYKSFKLLIHSNMKQPSKKWLRQPPDVGKNVHHNQSIQIEISHPKTNALYFFRIANEEIGANEDILVKKNTTNIRCWYIQVYITNLHLH